MRTRSTQKAIDDGYTFSGIYSRGKEEVTERAKELRKEGYKVRVLHQPSSKYERGNRGGGYSAYSKATEKKQRELKRQEQEKRNKLEDDLASVRKYLVTRNGDELVEMMKKVLKSDMSGLDGQWELISWAKKEGII